jgi:hypothetical protein
MPKPLCRIEQRKTIRQRWHAPVGALCHPRQLPPTKRTAAHRHRDRGLGISASGTADAFAKFLRR